MKRQSPDAPAVDRSSIAMANTVREFQVDLRRRQHQSPWTMGVTADSLPTRVPRVSRLMALAIRMQGMMREEPSLKVGGFAKLAVLGHVTRARITQIMSLCNLAPDIQEAILHLPRVQCPSGLRRRSRTGSPAPLRRIHERITERDIRPITTVMCWRRQRRMWKSLCTRRKVAHRGSQSET
jgi:hypothetical protein